MALGLALLPGCKNPVKQPLVADAAGTTGVAMTSTKPVIVVDLWQDVICPWCRIGHHNLRTALGNWQGDVTLNLHPYLLDPSVPPEGVDLRERLAERYAGANVEQMFARVTQIGAGYGVKFDFAQVRRTPDTTISHALILAAPPGKQSELLEAIQRAYFENGAEIGDAQVLQECWLQVGLPLAQAMDALADLGARAQVRQQADAATRKGIHGVPHFELHGPGGDVALQGAQAPEAIVAALQKVAK
jgi:predicted DsbA family dithiol-disulfide isomerase